MYVFTYIYTYIYIYIHNGRKGTASGYYSIFIPPGSFCINTFIFCVYYLYLIGRVYMFYVGHVDKSSLYETLFHIQSKHHHHQVVNLN
jgi:hypothetical protein